ncbi:MAG: undecaprenyl/decaprenyl-phosphate alpha-N-acetylglucosaminyl 1-phosphate transferase [Gammaproteobacteria bacterium]|nr:undecaprenyl/decaprenyl-phosphate alpha-N-acetylglucosaminyl 1-phosphate transferase [Gammaproteobacteria bacterium]
MIRTLIPLALRLGLVDYPDSRKQHQGSVPLIGGLSMFLGFLFAVLSLDVPLGNLRAMFAGAAIVVVVGILDDFNELSTRIRFAAQIGASLLMIYWGGVVLHDMGALGIHGGMAVLGFWSVPLTVFSTVGVINALNMSDGMDGQAGVLSLVAVASLAFIAWQGGGEQEFKVLLVLVSVLLGFLLFNLRLPGRRRALTFMGDAGSMFLGFVLTWFVVSLSQGEERIMTPVTSLWILLLPLFDTVGIMFRRMLKGQSPFVADREHFHHTLLHTGHSISKVLLISLGIALWGAAIGLVGLYDGTAENLLFYSFLALFALYFLGMNHAWKVKRFLGRSMENPGKSS